MADTPKTESGFFEYVDEGLVFFPLGPLAKGYLVPSQSIKRRLSCAFGALCACYSILGLLAVLLDDAYFAVGALIFAIISYNLVVSLVTRSAPRYHKRQSWLSFFVTQADATPYFAFLLGVPLFAVMALILTVEFVERLTGGVSPETGLIIGFFGVWLLLGWVCFLFVFKKKIERSRSDSSP